MMDDDECGAVGGMIGRRNRSSRRKPAPMPLWSAINPALLDLGSNPGSSGGKQETYVFHSGLTLNIRRVKIYTAE
jgi:hypothetical protein